MKPEPAAQSPELRPYHVLVTGFGPFAQFAVNPSWLAVRSLHNTVLKVDVAVRPKLPCDHPLPGNSDACLTAIREIHITVLQVPVTYEAVLSIIPGLHTRPPVLPPSSDPLLPTPSLPPDGYDLFFHVGVNSEGSLQIERIAHKFGYNKEDVTGSLAPIVHGETGQPWEAQRTHLRGGRDCSAESLVDGNETPKRGFGKGYEAFAEELHTGINVEKLVHHLQRCGVEQIHSSMDAGHYLCDFIYYCSLAESERSSAKNDESIRASQVIFLHCPPLNLPPSTEEVTNIIKESITCLCTL
ncbi:hypothetical protein V8B97DRAFT_1932984 [Scleroderma yunnanense]